MSEAGLSRPLGSVALMVLVQLVAGAVPVLLLLQRQVAEHGSASGGAIGLGPTMSGGIILVTVLVTSPLAAAEAWMLLAPAGRWVGVVAAATSGVIHGAVGSAPV